MNYPGHCGRKFTYVYSPEMQERIRQERLAIQHRINRVEQYRDLDACVKAHEKQARTFSRMMSGFFHLYLGVALSALVLGQIQHAWGPYYLAFFLFCSLKWCFFAEKWHRYRASLCAETLRGIDISDISPSAFVVH